MCQRAHICNIVPPHLLLAIADSSQNSEECRQQARQCLALRESITERRTALLQGLNQPRGYAGSQHGVSRPSIVPNHLLTAIVQAEDVDEETKSCAKRDLEHLEGVQAAYRASQEQGGEKQQHTLASAASKGQKKTKPAKPFYCAVYDAKHTEDESSLPGDLLRLEGQPPATDASANEAYDNAHRVLEFYKEHCDWNSLDGKGMHVLSSVHYSNKYENAFWDPDMRQMVYGDGGSFLGQFTKCIDVIGHEMTHAVTEHTSPLDYEGQAGALNEHVSDVFGIMVKQMVEEETADKADWLIGEGCLMPGVKGVALRSMKEPGTAYNDPRFGKDPQPANMDQFVATTEDNGGVHLNSGIPNKAFYNAAVAFGGYSFEKAGKIWWAGLNSGKIPPKCNFNAFADCMVETAEELYDEEAAKTVRKAFSDVGIVRKSHV